MKKTDLRFRDLPKDFTSLCKYHLPRPIHDVVELENTREAAATFAGQEEEMTDDQNDYFETLCTLIEDYETRQVSPFKKSSGLEMLQYLLSENKMSGAGLARILGVDRAHGTKLLRGERKLTLAHVRKLSVQFRVSADVFL
jgi:antitoxin component HigA of HigAB toxin-antitoxin module